MEPRVGWEGGLWASPGVLDIKGEGALNRQPASPKIGGSFMGNHRAA